MSTLGGGGRGIMIQKGELIDKSLFILKTRMYCTSFNVLMISPHMNHDIPLMYS